MPIITRAESLPQQSPCVCSEGTSHTNGGGNMKGLRTSWNLQAGTMGLLGLLANKCLYVWQNFEISFLLNLVVSL